MESHGAGFRLTLRVLMLILVQTNFKSKGNLSHTQASALMYVYFSPSEVEPSLYSRWRTSFLS